LDTIGFFTKKVSPKSPIDDGNIHNQVALTASTTREIALSNPDKVERIDMCDGSYSYRGDTFALLKEVSQFKNLKYLELCRTPIRSLPSQISNLTQLQYLHSIGGRLTMLPKEIGELKSLKYLSLTESEITFLPEELGKLESLEELDLSFNPVLSFPQSILKLPKLKRIYFYNTKISSLPKELKDMKSLEEIDVRETEIPLNDLEQLKKTLPEHINLIY
jgi:Leucine-rich repeat (LRR) protein